MPRRIWIWHLPVHVMMAWSACEAAVTISAGAVGSSAPGPQTESFVNGDFTIGGASGLGLFGDGVDENTRWTFDFSNDPDWAAFQQQTTIISAVITVSLETRGGVQTDALGIDGLPTYVDPFLGLAANQSVTLQFDLLEFYSSSDILGNLVTDPAGGLPMFFADDAILHQASLDLVAVPEPSGLAWLAFTTLFLGRRRSRP